MSSRVKLFEKFLTEIDINNGLVLEPDSLVYPPELGGEHGSVDFNVIDEDGRVWIFRCFTSCRVGGLATKPMVLGGWAEFARHHRLRAKDKIIFYGSQDEDNVVHFVIHVRRTIRLFGVDITQAD